MTGEIDACLLQRIHLTPIHAVPEGLYARTEGRVELARDRAVVHPWSMVSTRTYFGRFEASYWQRWTTVTDVEVSLRVRGRGHVTLMADDHLPGQRIADRVEVDAADEQTISLTASVDAYLDGGHFWVEARTTTESLEVADIRVRALEPGELRPTSVVICTFDRPDDCVATLAALTSDEEVLAVLDAVVVVDQGSRRVQDHAGLGEVATALGDRLRLLRQGNLGGAGGFTRGLLDTLDRAGGSSTNAILMDDDVQLEPETLLRLVAFDRHRRAPVLVGGQMLRRQHPSRLVSHAERTDLGRLVTGQPADPLAHDIDLLEVLPYRRADAEYNAWWTCLVPSEVLDAVGLPLPIFFQGDDIELGIRARHAGYPTVCLPGAAVWHDDFELKDWDGVPFCFRMRNLMIVASLHTGAMPGSAVDKLDRHLRNWLAEHRYGLTASVLQAVDQFLAGPDVLRDGGPAALATFARVRAEHPDTHRVTAADVDAAGLSRALMRFEGEPPPDRSRAANRRFWDQLRGRSLPEITLPSTAPWWHASPFHTVVVHDRSQDAFHIRRMSRRTLVGLGRQARTTLRRLRREGPRAVEQWRAALPELTGRDNWERILRETPTGD